MVSTLTRVLGPRHMALAEDVVQEALLKALQQWPLGGVPADPPAWLFTVARNRALDVLRREMSMAAKTDEIARLFTERGGMEASALDDQLAMILLCCHPALPREAHVPLTLKAACGFSTGEVARAFLLQESTAAQRIVRAKRLILEQNLRFELPERGMRGQRLDSVLETLYLMFNEGFSSGGEQLLRHDICEESIRLARVVAGHAEMRAPECDALLALLLLVSARSPARLDPQGDLFLLCDQDRSLWDRRRISEGMRYLECSAAGDCITGYHLQAGIAAAHACAPDFASTEWAQIVDLYDQLYALNPSPVVALNRAVAVSRWRGTAEGLRALAEIEDHPALARYHLLPATLGRLWQEAGHRGKAEMYYTRALEYGCSAPERRFLEKQLAVVKTSR